MNKFFTITEVAKILNLINPKTNKTQNYILRYWEKQFKSIKPKMIRNRRYYSSIDVETFKLIKFLLKTKGLSVSGAKNLVNTKINKLDDHVYDSLKADYYKKSLKTKSNLLLEKIKKLKDYGKKNSS